MCYNYTKYNKFFGFFMESVSPFIRWVGGKSWLIHYLPQIIGDLHVEHYHEPFLGGGAVFFALEHKKKSYLSDSNQQLINAYIQIRDNPNEVIRILNGFENTEENYYKVREAFNLDNTVENAARFIFLNQTSFNGVFRVSKTGKYNVPYGFRENWKYNEDRIMAASKKLKNSNICVGDFEVNKKKLCEGDLVFLDPPYTVSHNNNGFIEYNRNLFSLEDQQRLKKYIDFIKNKGAYYLLTNAAHTAIREIFYNDRDRVIELQRQSLIGGINAKRTLISEYIFTNIPRK